MLYKDAAAHRYLDRPLVDLHHRRIVAGLLGRFGVGPGDAVLEIGAGSGRYTEVLLTVGAKVRATEPDPLLFDRLSERFAGRPEVELDRRPVAELSSIACGARAICGFHVLHHLTDEALRSLATLCRALAQTSGFAGWFFLEPNPRNPLYVVQILMTPGMSFSEERGLWRTDRYRSLLGDTVDRSCRLGSVGLWPPRPLTRCLPERLQRIGTALSQWRSPVALYTVYGEMRGHA